MSIRNLFKKVLLCFFISMGIATCAFAQEKAESKSEEGSEKASGYLQLKPSITTNYQAPNLKYVRTDVAIRANGKVIDALTLHKDPVRDIIIMLLAKQDKQALTSSEGIAAIKAEAKEEISAFLESEHESGEIMDILFMSFLVE